MALINDLVAEFERLRALKMQLEEDTKANNKALQEIQEKIIDEMIDLDMPSVTIDTEGYGTFTYTPQVKTKYSLIGEERAQRDGIDRFEVLRENGFDFLIRETVNAQSFNSAITDYISRLDEGEDVPDDLAAIFSSYEDSRVARTKATKKALEKLKGARE